MKYQKLMAMILAVALLGLSACGSGPAPEESSSVSTTASEPTETTKPSSEEKLVTVLTAEDAILMDVEELELEGEGDDAYLTNWAEEDPAIWTMNVPASGTYQFVFEYAVPEDYEACTGWMVFAVDGVVSDALELSLEPTGSWDTYASRSFQSELSAGPLDLMVYANDLPDGQDYFMNLRKIEVWLLDGDGMETEDWSDPSEEPDEVLEGISGWWVRPEGYESEGLSFIDYFEVSEDLDTCTVYNVYGEAGDSIDCRFEGFLFFMDLGFDEAGYRVRNGEMLDPSTYDVEYIHVSEPEFRESDVELDGRWYLGGSWDAPYYEISGQEFRKIYEFDGEPFPEYEGTFSFRNVYQSYGDYSIPDMMKLDTGDYGKTLVPSITQEGILFEEDGLTETLYVHESYMDETMNETYALVNKMLEMDICSEEEDGKFYRLWFQPNCFIITEYEVDASGNYEMVEDSQIFGNWEIIGEEMLDFLFEDGRTEPVLIYEEADGFYFYEVGAYFEFDPIF